MSETPARVRFHPGTVVVTMGALQVATQDQLRQLLDRHVRGDWGVVGTEDAAENEKAVRDGERVLSAYDVNGERLWVLTTADRSETCVMTPGEY